MGKSYGTGLLCPSNHPHCLVPGPANPQARHPHSHPDMEAGQRVMYMGDEEQARKERVNEAAAMGTHLDSKTIMGIKKGAVSCSELTCHPSTPGEGRRITSSRPVLAT